MNRVAELRALREPPPVWAMAAILHVACCAASLALAARAPELLPGSAWCWLEGGAAAVVGAAVVRLPAWWLPINLLFVPAASALLAWQIPAAVYLAAFCTMFVINVAAWRHRVPLFLTTAAVTRELCTLLPQRSGFRFLDLGCGTGSLLMDIARLRPDGSYHGIETAPFSILLSQWRARANAAVRVIWGDFWSADLAVYDVVYAYLSPTPMPVLWKKARREMRPGSLLISNTFAIPGVAPAFTLPVSDRMHSVLYVWRM
jgi:SAM-dependent methyltransferase